MANKNLNQAKNAKKDEFYTQLVDIENELRHYRAHFKGKTVLCNCDDPRVSNFFHYFSYNFEQLGLKKLITTCYKNQNRDLFSQNDSERAIWLEYLGDKNGDRVPNPEEIGIHYFNGDGDFRSAECIELLKQADIVVTNPPFSLFREYVAQLMKYEKKFVIVGNINAVNYREIFPLVMHDQLWLGFSSGSKVFEVPSDFERGNTYVDEKGKKYAKFGNVCWFTNLDIQKRHEELILFSHYTPEEYPRYDNYDAIEVCKVDSIPFDYDGIMGVPLTFLDKYNPDQFEIIWRSHDIEWAENECAFFRPPTIEKRNKYKKADRTWRVQIPYITDTSDNAKMTYQRIFIRRRQASASANEINRANQTPASYNHPDTTLPLAAEDPEKYNRTGVSHTPSK